MSDWRAAWELLPDLESDFSVFHRVDDVRAMPARRFIDQAFRLSAYQGLLGALAAQEQEDGPSSAPRGDRGPRRVESSPAVLTSDPVLADLGEYSQVEEAVDG